MRLCFMIYSLSAGGAERVLSQLANHFAAKKEHDVHIITLQPEGAEPFYPLHSKITLHQLGLNQTGDLLGKLGRTFLLFWRLRQILQYLDPHKIISFVDEMNVTVLLSTLGLKKEIIISERTDPRHHDIGIISSALRHLLYPFAKTLVVQGKYGSDYFSYMQDNICIIPNSIPPFNTCLAPLKKLKKIITIGRLGTEKDQKTLIKAFSKLTAEFPEWSLEIYGEGPEKEALEKLITELSLQNKVLLKGLYSPIQEKLAEASIFVFPSLYEGFPNALGEAMSVGLPVIVSDCGGNLELVTQGENGLVFPAKNQKKLEFSLEELIKNKDKRDSLGKAAKESIGRFAPEKIYKQWEAIIEDVG